MMIPSLTEQIDFIIDCQSSRLDQCHREVGRRHNLPSSISRHHLRLGGSFIEIYPGFALWRKGAYNRFFPCMEATLIPYAIKTQRKP